SSFVSLISILTSSTRISRGESPNVRSTSFRNAPYGLEDSVEIFLRSSSRSETTSPSLRLSFTDTWPDVKRASSSPQLVENRARLERSSKVKNFITNSSLESPILKQRISLEMTKTNSGKVQ